MEPTKTEIRRDDLRKRLIDLAEIQIAQGGAASLKARDLATQAGCSLGAIYNVFDDIPALVMEVNLRTFGRLGVIAGHAQGLDAMGQAYLRFASANFHLWRALFDLPPGPVPDWYQAALDAMFALIEGPILALFPALPVADQNLMVRALFSAVHGIVLLGLQGPDQPGPPTDVARMVSLVLGEVGN
jgi:AcrR family transcriptional regulator